MFRLLENDDCIKKNTFAAELAFHELKMANTASYTASRCGLRRSSHCPETHYKKL